MFPPQVGDRFLPWRQHHRDGAAAEPLGPDGTSLGLSKTHPGEAQVQKHNGGGRGDEITKEVGTTLRGVGPSGEPDRAFDLTGCFPCARN